MELIYHYTDINALKSILVTHNLWLTSHRFLNDTREFEEGYQLLKNSIDECLIRNASNLKENTKSTVKEMIELLENTIVLSTSSSKVGDLLSQWRSYCPNDGGYAVGFDKNLLAPKYESSKSFVMLEECRYEKEEKDRLANIFGKQTIEGMDLKDRYTHAKRDGFYHTLYHWLLFVISAKNEYFKEEQEVRLATYIHQELKTIDISNMDNGYVLADYQDGLNVYSKKELSFRTKSNILIPYFEYKFDINAIQEIIIGPCKDKELAKESLKFFLKNIGLDNIKVKYSSIPYRSM